jgi:hypothetical protein
MNHQTGAQLGDLICGILTMIYREHKARFQREARRRRINLEQLAAAAVAGALGQYQQSAGFPSLLDPSGWQTTVTYDVETPPSE